MQVLNEVVIDRGPSPYLCNIDLFLDGKHITSVQGDGLIVSTPTGSTAYAVAAGASMVWFKASYGTMTVDIKLKPQLFILFCQIHPSVPAIMVTPICPHSLSKCALFAITVIRSLARCPLSPSILGTHRTHLLFYHFAIK